MTREQVLSQIGHMVAHARSLCDDIEFSPEDASRSDPDFLVEVLSLAIKEGATTLNIPDTVGYDMPVEYADLFRYLMEHTDGADQVIWSAHCHDDLGCATANTLAAIQAGARQVEVTINGIGERAGNTSLEEVVMALHTRPPDLRRRHPTEHDRTRADQPPGGPLHRHRRAPEQGDRRGERVRPRGRDPPARHAPGPAYLRDHDPADGRSDPEQAGPGQALRQARTPDAHGGNSASSSTVRNWARRSAASSSSPIRRRTSPTPTSRRWRTRRSWRPPRSSR